MGCCPRALGVRAWRERQRAKQTLHAVKLRGGDDFLYDMATAKSASTETSSVGSSAPRERRPLATELASVENRLDAEGIPHASLAHAPSLATELASVENRLDAEGIPHSPLSHAPARHRACLGGGGRAAELRAAGRAESYVPASRVPSVGWSRRLVRFLGCHMHAPCAHVSKRTTGAPRNKGVLPCGLRATRIRFLGYHMHARCAHVSWPDPTLLGLRAQPVLDS